jgi:hypothetical protein
MDSLSLKIGGRRSADTNTPLPFDHLQVWTKVQLQNRSYHTFSHLKQSMPLLRPRHGLLDAVTLFSSIQTTTKFGPTAALKVSRLVCPSHPTDFLTRFQGIILPSCLIFRAVPSRRAPYSPGTDLFPVYAQRFDIVPQLPPTGQGQSNQKGMYQELSNGMHLLKRARRTDGSIMGDVVPLAQLRTLVDLVPRFGKQANRQLAKETVLEFSSEFWLNKYFEKEHFYAFKGI